jgi:hypothetical protein
MRQHAAQFAIHTSNRLRFIRQNPPPSDFAENSLSNWINFRVADQSIH